MIQQNAHYVILYSPLQIAVGAFVGSPFAGLWFIFQNLRRLGYRQKGIHFLIWGSLVSVALLVGLCFLTDSIPPLVVPIAYAVIFYFLANRLFSQLPSDSNLDIQAASNWHVAGITLLWLILVFFVGLALIEFVPDGYFPGE